MRVSGLDGGAHPYRARAIARGCTEKAPHGDWSVIMRAASRIIDMCQGVSPRRK